MVKVVKRILLVDDNPVSQKLSEKVFKNDGYEVSIAWDRASCLAKAKECLPHAILMDIIFPGDDGREIVRALLKNKEFSSVPIIFATNTVEVDDEKGEESIDIDGKKYRAFAKPLHYPKLLSAVRKDIHRQLYSKPKDSTSSNS